MEMQARMLTGKNRRVTIEEKERLREEYDKKRTRLEMKNKGGF
jgi:hypothetical protein